MGGFRTASLDDGLLDEACLPRLVARASEGPKRSLALLTDLAEIAGLSGYERFAARGARMVPSAMDPAHGQSRLGGWPDLPRGTAWPEGPEGNSLAFLAQVRARDLPVGVLSMKRDAMISLFYDREEQPSGYDPQDRGRFRVRIDPVDDLVRTTPPLISERAASVQLVPVLTVPSFESPSMEHLDQRGRTRWRLVTELFQGTQDGEPQHQFGGHPQLLRGPLEEASAFTEGGLSFNAANQEHARARSLLAEARRWRLLFQLDREPSRNWYWGESGRLYATLREDHLAAHSGERAWVILQRR